MTNQNSKSVALNEVQTLAAQLKALAIQALGAIRERDEVLLQHVLLVRAPLLERVKELALVVPELVAHCPEMISAADAEMEVAAAARARYNELFEKWQQVRQIAAIRKAYNFQ